MPATVTEATPEHLRHVFAHLRADDYREVAVQRFEDGIDTDALAEEAIATWQGGRWTVLADDGEPVAVFGVAVHRPRAGTCWMLATDRLAEVAVSVTRACRAVVDAMLDGDDCDRLEATSWSGHTRAHEWLERALGFTREAVLARFAGGEDFIVFARLRKE